MKLLAFVPIKLTLLLIFGILIGHFFSIPLNLLLAITLAFLCFLGVLFKFYDHNNTLLFGIIATCTTISLGAYISTYAQPINHASHYRHLNIEQEATWKLKITDVLKTNQFSQNYIASVIGLDDHNVTGKILLSGKPAPDSTKLQIDDELLVYSKHSSINPALNPHQFNFKNYMEKLGVYDQIKLNNANYFKSTHSSRTIFGYAQKARNHIIAKLKSADFEKEQLSVIQALILGQRSDISEGTYSDYKNAGAVHILAVSGLHVGILLLLIQFLLRPLKNIPNGRTIILCTTVLLLWGFAFLAGLSPSIIRACAMFTFVAYALYLNRPTNTFNILALSMFFLLLFVDPNLLFQVGFQMSYAAVFAIVWCYPLLQKLWNPKNKIIRYIWQLLSVSIAAQLGVLPISLFYFHQFPGLFFISNLLIVPFLGLVLGIGILVVSLSLIDMLPKSLVWTYNEMIGIMNSLVAWVAKQEGFLFTSIPFDGIQLILGYIVIGTMIFMLTNISFKRTMVFLITVLCFQSWTIYSNYKANTSNGLFIFHQTKNSIVAHKTGKKLKVYTSKPERSVKLIENYAVRERIDTIKYDTLQNSYHINEILFSRIDSSGVYLKGSNGHIVLLTDSPKINLDRLITNTKPQIIIADGSNYSSYVQRWKATCLKNKLPFHYTGEKGAYTLYSLSKKN